MAAFRYVLELADGQPADPVVFNSAPAEWDVGDTFLSATFRILEIDDGAEGVAAGHADGVWIVEPVAE